MLQPARAKSGSLPEFLALKVRTNCTLLVEYSAGLGLSHHSGRIFRQAEEPQQKLLATVGKRCRAREPVGWSFSHELETGVFGPGFRKACCKCIQQRHEFTRHEGLKEEQMLLFDVLSMPRVADSNLVLREIRLNMTLREQNWALAVVTCHESHGFPNKA